MKIIKKIFIIAILLIIYTYVLAISSIPNNIIVFQGEDININTIFGIKISKIKNEYETVLTSSEIQTKDLDGVGKTTLKVNLFNTVDVKDVNVSIIPKTTVIPVGTIAGIKLYTNGVLVVGMSEIQGEDSISYKPYENSGIKEGDTIISVDNINIASTKDLVQIVNSSKGENVDIKYLHDGQTLECSIKPTKTNVDEYKIGLWVRDSAAGVGTVTYYEPKTQMFGALGHGITDIDTGELIKISSGEFLTTKVLSIIKGEKGNPGKIQGTVENQKNIGQIYKNTEFGIYGNVSNFTSLNINSAKELDVALREEIKEGKAVILASLDGNKPQEYEVEIEKIYVTNNYDNKSMLVKITDKELLEKTGGIIQGMSGAPIIQNGKFIGAITNVLVNDPTKGYAIFGDMMIKQMREVK